MDESLEKKNLERIKEMEAQLPGEPRFTEPIGDDICNDIYLIVRNERDRARQGSDLFIDDGDASIIAEQVTEEILRSYDVSKKINTWAGKEKIASIKGTPGFLFIPFWEAERLFGEHHELFLSMFCKKNGLRYVCHSQSRRYLILDKQWKDL